MSIVFGLVRVTVSTEVAPGATEDGVKAFTAVGRASTSSEAEAPAEEPAFAVVTLPVEFTYELADALVTFTVTVHEPFAGTVPPESARLVPALAPVTTPAAQVVAGLGVAVFTRPAGYVSVNAAPVTAVAFGFVSVTVSTLVAFTPMDAGVKDLATVSALLTESVALAATRLAPALPVVSPPAATVFTWPPVVDAVTLTVTVHEPFA